MALLSQKVAVITGVNSGIGRKTAELFAQQGAKIVGVDVCTDNMDALQEHIESAGSELLACRCDVRDAHMVEDVFKAGIERFGKIDMVINIAGISRDHPISRTTDEEYQLVMDINAKGVFNFCRCATPYFKKQKHGVIVNTSSVTGIYGSGMGCVYNSSKGAIMSLTKSLAIELAPWNIRVNAVAPGVVDTEMTAMLGERERKCFNQSIPLKRMAEPEDIAASILFLASDWSSYITGEILSVDGGYRPPTINS